MSARPYHKRYHSDALAGFMALTLEERGAYQTLLDLMYDRQGPLIDNERLLAGYMGASIRKWRSLRDALISKGKIHLTEDGLISNARFEKEIENDAKTSRKLSENGSKGGRKKAENEKNPNENNERDLARPEQNPSLNQSPETRYKPPTPFEAKASDRPPAEKPGKVYAFLGRTIRLTQRDFDQWSSSYHAIVDLRAELQALDDWLQGPKVPEQKRRNWFNGVSANLRRKHEEALAAQDAQAAADEAFFRRHPKRDLPDSELRLLLSPEEYQRRKATAQ